MANALGYVTETKGGFEGTLAMMNLSAPIRIEKNAETRGRIAGQTVPAGARLFWRGLARARARA
ncbi:MULTISPECIES: hypothetical protein [Hyphomonas]|uniref:hypothetical protein n=1 Tax=Hyphomonas TaxID=85 RepID=UPI0002F591C4|nr:MULTISPECIES: hypothetical protein [Hyphomonas]